VVTLSPDPDEAFMSGALNASPPQVYHTTAHEQISDLPTRDDLDKLVKDDKSIVDKPVADPCFADEIDEDESADMRWVLERSLLDMRRTEGSLGGSGGEEYGESSDRAQAKRNRGKVMGSFEEREVDGVGDGGDDSDYELKKAIWMSMYNNEGRLPTEGEVNEGNQQEGITDDKRPDKNGATKKKAILLGLILYGSESEDDEGALSDSE
jgi:hypothetical protein